MATRGRKRDCVVQKCGFFRSGQARWKPAGLRFRFYTLVAGLERNRCCRKRRSSESTEKRRNKRERKRKVGYCDSGVARLVCLFGLQTATYVGDDGVATSTKPQRQTETFNRAKKREEEQRKEQLDTGRKKNQDSNVTARSEEKAGIA